MLAPIGYGSNATIKVVTGNTEKIFTDLYKAKSYYIRLFKMGKDPRIVRISEREKPMPTSAESGN